MKNYKLSLIIPANNEENNIEKMYERCKEVLDDNVQYIFVDDGSKDNTLNEIRKITQNDKDVLGLSFSRNFGKEAAIYCGLNYSKGEYTTIIDCDLQQDPSYIIEMLNILDNDKDIDCVCAKQKKRKENTILSIIKSIFYKTINSLSENDFENGASDFRTFRTNIKEALLSLKETNRFLKGMFPWIGFNTKYIEYEVKERESGKTKFSFKRLFTYALKGITSFSNKPLLFSLYLGIISIIISLIYLFINLSVFDTNKIIVFLLLLLFGLLFIILSILGNYLGSIYDQSKQRPIYILKEEIGNDE